MPREIDDNTVGRVEREDRPAHRPIMRVYSGNCERDNLLALSQMENGVPTLQSKYWAWTRVCHHKNIWMREKSLYLEWDEIQSLSKGKPDV